MPGGKRRRLAARGDARREGQGEGEDASAASAASAAAAQEEEEAEEVGSGGERKEEEEEEEDEEEEEEEEEEDGVREDKIVVVLLRASLETVKTRKGDFQLLNCDDHISLLRKHGRELASVRPDIVHGELLALLDSPLNKAGKLQVYIHTTKNVLISVDPSTRIPRTFKRFSGLMDGRKTLFKVIKNPISRHLPAGARMYGMSSTGTLYSPMQFAATHVADDRPTVFFIGAMATGHITVEEHPYIEEMISISEYPLSGAVAISRLMGGIEAHRGIL